MEVSYSCLSGSHELHHTPMDEIVGRFLMADNLKSISHLRESDSVGLTTDDWHNYIFDLN